MDIRSLDPKNANIILGKKYKLKELLGKGSFGQIFRALVKGTDEQVAVKLEKHKKSGNLMLSKEAKVLSDLNDKPGFPKLIAFGKEDSFHYMALTLLGANLNMLLKECRGKFDLKTTLMIADQVLTLIETLHEYGYVHRDIKPNNFLIGKGLTEKNVFLIDFGLTQPYKDAQGKHINFRDKKGLIGTARYASINAHLGYELSRRDDLESVGYMLIYFMKGRLPWQDAKGASKHEKYKIIADMKTNLSVDTLCKGLPKEFVMYLSAVKSLGFQETPNYKSLKLLFRSLFIERGFEFDHCYSWIRHQTSDFRSLLRKNSKLDNEEAQNTTDFALSKGGNNRKEANKQADKKKMDLIGMSKFGSRVKSQEEIKFEGPYMISTNRTKNYKDFFDDSSSKIMISGEDEIPTEIDPEILPSQKVQKRVYNKFETASTNQMVNDDWNLPSNNKSLVKQQRSRIAFAQSRSLEHDSKKYSLFRSETSKRKGFNCSEPPSSDDDVDEIRIDEWEEANNNISSLLARRMIL